MDWRSKLNIDRIFTLKYGGTQLFFGAGAVSKISMILEEFKKEGLDRVLVITGKSSYKVSGAWNHVEKALREYELEYHVYNKVPPNPTVDIVNEAVRIGKEFNAKVVLGIGGGSSIDTAKATGCLLAVGGDARELFMKRDQPTRSLPVVAVNLTHGTGSEVNRYGVETIPEKNYKIGMPLTYPTYSIDDPQLMVRLDRWQTIATAIDALNHATEAATNKLTTPFSINLSRESMYLIFKYLPTAIIEPDNLLARYYLLYASMLAGIAVDHVGAHLTHALEHPISAINPEVPHGIGLGILLPSVLKIIYPTVPEILVELYKPIAPYLKADPGEARELATIVKKWLFSIGLNKRLTDYGFTEKDLPELIRLVNETPGLKNRLELSPAIIDEEIIRKIYRESL